MVAAQTLRQGSNFWSLPTPTWHLNKIPRATGPAGPCPLPRTLHTLHTMAPSLQQTFGQGGQRLLAVLTTNSQVSSPLVCQLNTFHINLHSPGEVRAQRESHGAGWCHRFRLEMVFSFLS